MTARRVLVAAASYVVALTAVSIVIVRTVALDPHRDPTDLTIVSVWQNGRRLARAATRADPASVLREAAPAGALRVLERVVDEGPLLGTSPWLLGASVVSGRDGLHVSYQGRECYVTPDDLLREQLYPGRYPLGRASVTLGVDAVGALRLLAKECGASVADLLTAGRFRRFLVRRTVAGRPASPVTAPQVTPERLLASVRRAGEYLVRHQRPDGTYDYEIDAITGQRTPGYSWPRHAGATLFLTDAAEFTGDERFERAAVRGARCMHDQYTLRCGSKACVGSGRRPDLGSSALALLVYVAVVRAGFDDGLHDDVAALAAFVRSQQRPDGEFMHLYDRVAQRPVDVQLPYYSGEAALALARAERLTGDAADLEAARRALHYLVDDGRAFFGNRYLYDQEHWTCQAMEDLWRRAPDPAALRFCLGWAAFNRSIQLDASTDLGDYDGGFSEIPTWTPRLCPAGSRTEAAVATLVVATAAGVGEAERAALESQIRRAIGFALRYQFDPGPNHLMADAASMRGGYPGSPYDFKARIDLPQHLGGAMLRYLRLLEQRSLGTSGGPP
jgi:hypothetical protein